MASSGSAKQLFSENSKIGDYKNLVIQMLPKTLNEFVGQRHILSPNLYLYELLKHNEIPNLILWGPPGCGKTSLVNIIQHICMLYPHKYEFKTITSLNDINFKPFKTKIIVVYIDELKKFNRVAQGRLLSLLEKGGVVLVATTRENPSFLSISKLLEYCKTIVLNKLESEDLIKILSRTLGFFGVAILDDINTVRNYCIGQNSSLSIKNSTVEWLAANCDGDARIALNNLELVLQNHEVNKKVIDIKNVRNEIKKKHLVYDHDGEEHHNIISAMHESIKGYNDNASLYWTTRMIMSGEDPLFIARRLVRASSEDTGIADVNALKLAVSTMLACKEIDKDDSADVFLAQCATYLARAPTKKTVFVGLDLAKKLIKESGSQQPEVPIELCYNSTKLGLFGNCAKSYMPAGLEHVNFL